MHCTEKGTKTTSDNQFSGSYLSLLNLEELYACMKETALNKLRSASFSNPANPSSSFKIVLNNEDHIKQYSWCGLATRPRNSSIFYISYIYISIFYLSCQNEKGKINLSIVLDPAWPGGGGYRFFATTPIVFELQGVP